MKARIEPELGLLIQLLLYKLSLWDSGASYGAKLQDLRYVVPPSPGSSLARVSCRILRIFGSLLTYPSVWLAAEDASVSWAPNLLPAIFALPP